MRGMRALRRSRTMWSTPQGLLALGIKRRGRAAWPLLLFAALCVAALPAVQPVTAMVQPHTTAQLGGWAWGYNSLGQLGNGTTTQQTTPVPIDVISNVVALAATAGPPGDLGLKPTTLDHGLALAADGSVWTWGDNSVGQMGTGSGQPCGGLLQPSCANSLPQQVAGFTGLVPPSGQSSAAIAAGGGHDLALAADGSLWAWGADSSGQLGNNLPTTAYNNLPTQVVFSTTVDSPVHVTAVAAGYNHSLALGADGTVWTWGSNSNGQLGTTVTLAAEGLQVPGLSGVSAIAAGGNFSLALKSDGTVWAWGDNSDGQAGNQTVALGNVSGPVQVLQQSGQPLSGITALAAGVDHALALDSSGHVWAWGLDSSLQLGAANTGTCGSLNNQCSQYPVEVLNSQSGQPLSGITAIAAGADHSAALDGSGVVWTWGANGNGQVGNGGTTTAVVPGAAPVSGLSGATGVAAGGNTTLAIAPGPTLSASSASVDFGFEPQGATGTQAITLTNTSPVNVAMGTMTLTQPVGVTPFGGSYSACQNVTIPPGQSCTFTLTYTPAFANATASGSLSIPSNAAGSPLVISLNGTSTNGSIISLNPSNPIDFGSVVKGTTSPVHIVSVTNNGPYAVTIGIPTMSNPNLLGANPFAFTSDSNCEDVTLAAGQLCTLGVTYTPQFTGQPANSTLSVPFNGTANVATVSLSGIGIVAPTSTPTSLATSTPTITPTPVRTPTVAPTLTPEATFPAISTPTPTHTPKPKPKSKPTPKPGSKKPTHHAPISASLSPARVISGKLLTVHIHTAAHAKLDSTLKVTTTKQTFTGKGKKRKKVTKTVVLSSVHFKGSTDGKGNFVSPIRILYNPSKPVQAHLSVTASPPHGKKLTAKASATILPKPKAKAKPKSVGKGKKPAHTTTKPKPKTTAKPKATATPKPKT